MMTPALERRQFLRLALIVEGGLVVLAAGLSWLLDVPLLSLLKWNPSAIAWGMLATVPLCVIFVVAYWRPVGSYRRIKDFLLDSLGASIAACRWYELLLVAALAGIGEELVFRGVLQIWLEQWGYWASLIVSNIAFALCHAITLTYTILAFVMGVFLGLIMDASEKRSLLAPILTHGLYDFFAFCVLAMDWRARNQEIPEAASQTGEDSLPTAPD